MRWACRRIASASPESAALAQASPTPAHLVENGAPPVAIVSYELWRTALGSDPNVLSRSIQLGTRRALVVDVDPLNLL